MNNEKADIEDWEEGNISVRKNIIGTVGKEKQNTKWVSCKKK